MSMYVCRFWNDLRSNQIKLDTFKQMFNLHIVAK